MSWLAKLISRTSSNSVSPTTSPRGSTTGDVSKTTSLPAARPLGDFSVMRLRAEAEATTERALRLAGVTRLDAEAVQYFSGFCFIGLAGYTALIRDGEKMTPDAKKLNGIKTRAIIGDKFFSYLNEVGRLDPQAAAHAVLAIAGRQQECVRDLNRGPDFMDGDTRLKFFPSNMAAGPCARARSLERKLVEPNSAPLVPFEDCSHADQCGCRYLMKRYNW